MERLLKEKLEAAKEFRSFTKEIMELSLKTDFAKVNSMLDQRQQFIEKINYINQEINNYEIVKDSNETTDLKKEIREVFKEINEIDNLIRKNINGELKSIKKKLNQPEKSINSLNIKA